MGTSRDPSLTYLRVLLRPAGNTAHLVGLLECDGHNSSTGNNDKLVLERLWLELCFLSINY